MVTIGMLVTNMRMLIQIASTASLRPRIKPESGDRNFMRTSLLGGAAIVFIYKTVYRILFLVKTLVIVVIKQRIKQGVEQR